MAKMLDALARAQRERSQQLAAQDPQSADPGVQPVVAQPDVRGAFGLTPVTDFGAAPAAEPKPSPVAPTPVAPLPADDGVPNVHPSVSDLVIAAHDAFSPIAEQARQIRTNLESVLGDRPSRSIVITSPVKGDGKSLVSANLAWVLTDNPEHRVLLIDADLRKPDQNRLFGVRRAPGMSEYLLGKCRLDDAIHPTSMSNLFMMPAGRAQTRPTSLLNGRHLPAMIAELEERFDWIVFDTPPLLPVTDAALIARHCTGLILIVRMGQTHRKLIERAQDLLAENRLPVLGCVLNEFSPKETTNDYYSSHYAYGYRTDDGK